MFAFLGETRASCLSVFHALSGCDTTSAFVGKGKRSAWQAWQQYNAVTPTLAYLAENPFQHLDADSEHFQKIERMAVIMYDKSCPCDSINEARKELFCKQNRAMDKLPPTKVTKICKLFSNAGTAFCVIFFVSTQLLEILNGIFKLF